MRIKVTYQHSDDEKEYTKEFDHANKATEFIDRMHGWYINQPDLLPEDNEE